MILIILMTQNLLSQMWNVMPSITLTCNIKLIGLSLWETIEKINNQLMIIYCCTIISDIFVTFICKVAEANSSGLFDI